MAILRNLAVGLMAATFAFSASAQDDKWQEGEDYERLPSEVNASSGDGIEVAEVFWYGCGYCMEFESHVKTWKEDLDDDIDFVYLAAPMNRAAAAHAKAFYAMEALEARDRTHDAFYKALAEERRDLTSASDLADFVAEHGVDREEFLKAFESFGVKAQTQRAMSVLRGAQVQGTPTMLVAGKYRTSPSMTGGYEETLEVVDYLVEKERSERAE
ncbi:MAG: thiol:disulfide interchange protein DsbA/DsbL [Marinobacter sp.]